MRLNRATLHTLAGGPALLAIDDVQASPGQIVTLTGPSGSGKSTLLAALGGRHRAIAGQWLVAGVDLAASSQATVDTHRRQHIAPLTQSGDIVGSFTLAENARLGAEMRGESLTAADVEALTARLGIHELMNRRPFVVSGGQRQRAAIARVLLSGAQVLVMDEPTSALDANTARVVTSLVREYCKTRGAIAVIATHNNHFDDAAALAWTIRNGTLTQETS